MWFWITSWIILNYHKLAAKQKHISVIMALEESHIFWRKYRMGCLVYRTAALFIWQVLHWTVGKYLTHAFHPTIVVTLHGKTRSFQEKKVLGNFWCYRPVLKEKKSNSLPLPLFSKLKSRIIFKQLSNITWHIHILKMLSIINYLSERIGFNTDST